MTLMMLVLDGLGARSVDKTTMPTLASWAERGISRPEGANSVMCASTYPNFASIVTGREPSDHGILTNQVVVDGVPFGASAVGPTAPSFFDETSEVVVGDHNLIGVMAARSAGRHWPFDGEIPEGAGLDLLGYLDDHEVGTRVIEALERRPDFLFAQINNPDTTAHVYGPDSDEAIETHRSLDRWLAAIDDRLDPGRDLLLVTSDHDQETVDPDRRIDLTRLAREKGVEVTVVDEGTAAMLVGADGDGRWFASEPGVEGWTEAAAGVTLVFSRPGWWFAGPLMPDFRGAHGGPRTRATVAVVDGPERFLAAIRPRFLTPGFGAADWWRLVRIARGSPPG